MGKRRKMNADHVRPRNVPAPSPEAFEAHLEELVSPLVSAQLSYYRQLGLRERILTLPLMVAAVLTLVWRQVPAVHELVRLLEREDLLWAKATKVSQQAFSERLLVFPAELFERVLMALVEQLNQRWHARTQRPLPASLKWATQRFDRVWIVDGSSLEALFKKLNSLKDVSQKLGGKIYAIVDGCTHLPVQVKFENNPNAADTNQWQWLRALMPCNTLLLMDRGFYDFTEFAALVEQGSHWITRLKKASFRVIETFSHSSDVVDQLICLGHKRGRATPIVVRLIKVRQGKTWYSYITSVTDPRVLPPYVVADLYAHRWQIEILHPQCTHKCRMDDLRFAEHQMLDCSLFFARNLNKGMTEVEKQRGSGKRYPQETLGQRLRLTGVRRMRRASNRGGFAMPSLSKNLTGRTLAMAF